MRIEGESNAMKIFDIRSNKFKEVKAQVKAPKDPAYYQMPGVLLISGG